MEGIMGSGEEKGRRVGWEGRECHLAHTHLSFSRDAAVLVTSVNIHKGDSGSIIVGGRQEDLREPEESLHRYPCMCCSG